MLHGLERVPTFTSASLISYSTFSDIVSVLRNVGLVYKNLQKNLEGGIKKGNPEDLGNEISQPN
jgi:hypothetical protein